MVIIMNEMNIKETEKCGFWSYVLLFFVTGIIGSVFFSIIGVIVSKIFKLKGADYGSYCWRGISLFLVIFGIFVIFISIITIIDEGISHVVSSLVLSVIFGGIPIYVSINYFIRVKRIL